MQPIAGHNMGIVLGGCFSFFAIHVTSKIMSSGKENQPSLQIKNIIYTFFLLYKINSPGYFVHANI